VARVRAFCNIDFSRYQSEMEDCFSSVAFDVLENAANVYDFILYFHVYKFYFAIPGSTVL